jgi:hypothetical protein
VDEVAELEWIAHEEDRGVVAGHVPVALFGVELHGEAARIAGGVSRTFFAGYGGETGQYVGLLANLAEQLGGGVFCNVAGDREGAVRARALGVNHAFGDALAVELRHFLEKKVVLHEHRAARAGGYGVLVISDRTARRGGHVRAGWLLWFVC